MRIVKILGLMLLVAAVIYFCGPTPAKPHYNTQLPTIPETVSSLEWYVQTQNQQHRIKPGNEAAIVWQNDSVPAPTDYVLLYLHGFSASQEEGNPVHRNIAKTLGCNLYLARLSEHGIDTTDALINMTAESLWNSAKEAYAIAKNLGKKVIVVG
ncbi:MAG: alpha/beta hydrolase, partial [Chitinophagaceae bacterium]